MAQRVTMQHIADAVHMSRASVSAVLGNKPHCFVSEKNRAHILQTAVRLGYTPNLLARGLRNGRTRMIGLLCTSLQSEIHQQEMVLLTNLLLEHGYSSNIVYYKGEMEKLRTSGSELVARGCDALVISRAQHGKGNEEHENGEKPKEFHAARKAVNGACVPVEEQGGEVKENAQQKGREKRVGGVERESEQYARKQVGGQVGGIEVDQREQQRADRGRA